MKNSPIKFLSSLGILFTCLSAGTANAAERIYVSYSFLERSISIESLEIYAREGRYTDNLATYGRFFSAEQLEQARSVLLQPVDLDALTIAQFLYTPIGERLLQRVSQVVRPKSGISGFHALRASLILAASEKDGLTALNVLKAYPTQGIQVDLTTGLTLFGEVQQLVAQTNSVVRTIEAEAKKQANAAPFDGNADYLSRFGPLKWQTRSMDLTDESQLRAKYTGRSRSFPVDVYLPIRAEAKPSPVVVISHGLNSERSSFVYLAEHLASWGYNVIVPEHPGSNKEQIQSLLNGRANDVIEQMEFLDRPLDIKFALDEFERRADSDIDLKNQFDLENVVVIGQSFGGYTALALGGAPLDFETLNRNCTVNLEDTFNLSLLLQCLALRIPPDQYQLSDSRVKGIIAMNPVGGSLFGQTGLSQIRIPTLIVGGSADTVAPIVPEQVYPFSWLTTEKKYFALINAGTHFSLIETVDDTPASQQLQVFLGRRPDVARDYMKALALSFVNAHLLNQGQYERFLSSNYGAALSKAPLPLSVVRDFSPEFLNQLPSVTREEEN